MLLSQHWKSVVPFLDTSLQAGKNLYFQMIFSKVSLFWMVSVALEKLNWEYMEFRKGAYTDKQLALMCRDYLLFQHIGLFQSFPNKNHWVLKKNCIKIMAHAIYTHLFFFLTYTLLFCWKIKNCCNRCFPQQIRPPITVSILVWELVSIWLTNATHCF